MTISYAITACNEHVELERLLDQLNKYISPEDEIMVQLDNNATYEVKKIAEKYNIGSKYEYHRIFFDLNNDFASFKNNLKEYCTRDWIVFLDADEYFNEYLIGILKSVLLINSEIECIKIPRVNIVEGITEKHIIKWGWNLNEKNWVNYPDFQMRICKNIPRIKWEGKIHEKLVGWKNISQFPMEEEWSLIHPKTINKQEQQNKFYESIIT